MLEEIERKFELAARRQYIVQVRICFIQSLMNYKVTIHEHKPTAKKIFTYKLLADVQSDVFETAALGALKKVGL